MTFDACIKSAVAQKAISKEEGDDLLNELTQMEEAYARSNQAKTRKQAKKELESKLREAADERRRVSELQVNANDRIAQTIRRDAERRAANGQKPNVQQSLYGVFENIGSTGQQSVRGRMESIIGETHAEMESMLHAFRRSALTSKRFMRPVIDDVARAAFGENVSNEAKTFYQSFRAGAEKLRARFNAAGGHIAFRDDWGLPMFHSPDALAAAKFEAWRDFISPRLDWDKMAHSVSGLSILEEERDGVLRHVFESIVMDGWNKRAPSRTQGVSGRALYNKRGDPRFLTFKDAQAWLDYNREFGAGDVYNTMSRHVFSMARDVAAMEILGPKPRATIEWMKEIIASEAAKARAERPSLFKENFLTGNRRPALEAQRTIDGFAEQALGRNNPSSPIGDGVAAFRSLQYGAKLGGAVITHTMGNPVIQMAARYLHGFPVWKTAADVFKNLSDKRELTQAGLIMQDATHTLERGARQQIAMRKLREVSEWLPYATTHYSGLEAVVSAHRRAGFQAQMGTWALHLDKDFSALPKRLRETWEGNGLRAADWEIARRAKPHDAGGGAPFLRFNDIEAIGGDAAKETAHRYLTMLYQVNEALTPSSNWRVKAKTARAGGEGTAMGEITRSAMMFKGGFMATLMLSQIQLIAREVGARPGTAAAYMGSFAIGLSLAGMATLQLKQLRAGKDLMNMNPSTEEGLKTWEHAFLTSGALGLFGDFIHSETSSYGHGLASTLAGPVATGLEDVALGAGRAASWAAAKAVGGEAKGNPASDLIKAARNNTPVVSTHWALSAAYNRMILDQLQFMSDPEAHRALRDRERRLLRDTGQRYFWRPGDPLPDRAPAIAHN